MMNYTRKSFTVAGPGTKEYADNWERTFRGAPGEEHLHKTVLKAVRKDLSDKRVFAFDWFGPLPSDLCDGPGVRLKHPVPAERWPFGSPLLHEGACLLRERGLYCDCRASAADEPDWGYSP